ARIDEGNTGLARVDLVHGGDDLGPGGRVGRAQLGPTLPQVVDGPRERRPQITHGERAYRLDARGRRYFPPVLPTGTSHRHFPPDRPKPGNLTACGRPPRGALRRTAINAPHGAAR